VPEAEGPRPQAILEIEGMGEIHVELLPDLAPVSVETFIALAQQDYYDGVTFHRVIPDFMLQTGDPNTRNRDPRDDGLGDPPEFIPDEFSQVSHLRGIVSLANEGRPKSGGAQFFIVLADSLPLDGRHAVFGRVTEGMEVADRIAAVEVDLYGRHGPRDRPVEDVVLRDVRIAPAPEAGAAPEPPR
jgi:peptidyl-prolyl cis-trans isomerase B (cyclophilin B)